MIYLEALAPTQTQLCRGCGDTARHVIVFAIGPKISPETVPLCDDCADELGALAEQRRLLIRSRG